MNHDLPSLPYDHDALEPVIDEQTMRTHHRKHHQGYTDKFNAALQEHADHDAHGDLLKQDAETILLHLNQLPDSIKDRVRQNGGGYANHKLFFNHLTPEETEPSADFKDRLAQRFGSLDDFKQAFKDFATSQFGSGWAWLTVNQENELELINTANQNNPLLYGKRPIMGVDVWEHAYYLNYQNKRGEYVENVLTILDWQQIEANYEDAM
jgi:Fe-Mn family superoxide dismutase